MTENQIIDTLSNNMKNSVLNLNLIYSLLTGNPKAQTIHSLLDSLIQSIPKLNIKDLQKKYKFALTKWIEKFFSSPILSLCNILVEEFCSSFYHLTNIFVLINQKSQLSQDTSISKLNSNINTNLLNFCTKLNQIQPLLFSQTQAKPLKEHIENIFNCLSQIRQISNLSLSIITSDNKVSSQTLLELSQNLLKQIEESRNQVHSFYFSFKGEVPPKNSTLIQNLNNLIAINNQHVSIFVNLSLDWFSKQHSKTSQPKPSLINILTLASNEMTSLRPIVSKLSNFLFGETIDLQFLLVIQKIHSFFSSDFQKYINQEFQPFSKILSKSFLNQSTKNILFYFISSYFEMLKQINIFNNRSGFEFVTSDKFQLKDHLKCLENNFQNVFSLLNDTLKLFFTKQDPSILSSLAAMKSCFLAVQDKISKNASSNPIFQQIIKYSVEEKLKFFLSFFIAILKQNHFTKLLSTISKKC
jgi:hypothetical protein